MAYSLERRSKIAEWIERDKPSPEVRDVVVTWIADVLLVDPLGQVAMSRNIAMGLPLFFAWVPDVDVVVEYAVTRKPAYERDSVWLNHIASRPA